MQNIQTTSIIRARGQLTISGSIREVAQWVAPGSVVSIAMVKPDEIVIKPHSKKTAKANWDKLWKSIELSRSYKGVYSGSLSQFIVTDRENRR